MKPKDELDQLRQEKAAAEFRVKLLEEKHKQDTAHLKREHELDIKFRLEEAAQKITALEMAAEHAAKEQELAVEAMRVEEYNERVDLEVNASTWEKLAGERGKTIERLYGLVVLLANKDKASKLISIGEHTPKILTVD